MELSKNYRLYDLDGNSFIVVNTFHKKPLRISGINCSDIRKNILNNNTEKLPPQITKLLTEYYIITEDHKYSFDADNFKFPLNEVTIYILLTNNCNNACQYCFSSIVQNNKNETSIDVNNVVASIKKLSGIADKIKIVFFGGEPLLKWQELKEIVVELNRQTFSKKLQFSITSNLTLKYSDLISFSKEYKLGYLTDIDGFELQHNMLRPSRNKESNYSYVIENVKALLKNKINCDVRTTVTSINIDILPELVEFFKTSLGLKYFNFPPLSVFDSSGSLINLNLLPSPDKYLMFLESLLFKHKIQLNNIYPFHGYFHKYLSKTPANTSCGMVKGHVLQLDPEGNIYPCSYLSGDRKFMMGNYKDEDIDLPPIFRTLRRV